MVSAFLLQILLRFMGYNLTTSSPATAISPPRFIIEEWQDDPYTTPYACINVTHRDLRLAASYQGSRNVTISGKPCAYARWQDGNNNNFCRNEWNPEMGATPDYFPPWCWVSLDEGISERCFPYCPHEVTDELNCIKDLSHDILPYVDRIICAHVAENGDECKQDIMPKLDNCFLNSPFSEEMVTLLSREYFLNSVATKAVYMQESMWCYDFKNSKDRVCLPKCLEVCDALQKEALINAKQAEIQEIQNCANPNKELWEVVPLPCVMTMIDPLGLQCFNMMECNKTAGYIENKINTFISLNETTWEDETVECKKWNIITDVNTAAQIESLKQLKAIGDDGNHNYCRVPSTFSWDRPGDILGPYCFNEVTGQKSACLPECESPSVCTFNTQAIKGEDLTDKFLG